MLQRQDRVHENDRPRERLETLGASALSERELLAVVLGEGGPFEAFDIAGALVHQWGGLTAMACAYPEELTASPGVGPAKAAAVVAAFELGRRVSQPHNGVVLRRPADIARVARPYVVGHPRERVVVLVCNSRHQVRRVVTVSQGSIDRATMPVREVVNAVLRHDGRAFALAHYHPSGDPTPSSADHQATGKVVNAAAATGLRFLGHVIVGGDSWEVVS